jgi:murein L,D-transpeptidase YcbB/YkuD
MNWDEKNKEFVKTVQKVIGVEADGLAGNKTIAAFENFAKSKGSSDSEIKEAWNKLMELLK